MIGWKFEGIPEEIVVRCRRCQNSAKLLRPFVYLAGPAALAASEDPTVRGHWAGGRFVVERFPAVLPWKKGHGTWFGFSNGAVGVVTCVRCPAQYVHRLTWPKDAYFSVSTRVGTLWAWNREWLIYVRGFIAGSSRPDGYLARHLPTEFKLAKQRKHMVDRIDAALAAAS